MFHQVHHRLGASPVSTAFSIVPFTGRWALPLQPVIAPHSATTAATINHCFICFIFIVQFIDVNLYFIAAKLVFFYNPPNNMTISKRGEKEYC
jgi:hypothetical protein